MNAFIETISNITSVIKPIAPPLAGLILVVIGIMYMVAKDPNKKSSIAGWMINVLVGFGIVYLGIAIVDTLQKVVVGF